MIWLLISVVLLIVLIFFRIDILLVAPIVSVFLCLVSGLDVVDTLAEGFMPAFATFAKNNFLIFMTSAMFARAMQDTGMAASIARGISSKLAPKICNSLRLFRQCASDLRRRITVRCCLRSLPHRSAAVQGSKHHSYHYPRCNCCRCFYLGCVLPPRISSGRSHRCNSESRYQSYGPSLARSCLRDLYVRYAARFHELFA